MKNQLKIGLIAAILSFIQFSAYSMQANFGYIASFDCTISTYKYVNNGTIYGMNSVKMDVSSLTGTGTISAAKSNVGIKTGYFGYSGTISAREACSIKAKTFEGTATIDAPYIYIDSDEFKFSGTLSCDKNCRIYSKKAFDTNTFKRVGKGTFAVIISPYDVRYFSKEGLSSISYNYFCSNCLNLNESEIDNKIKEIRTYAALNFIDDKSVLEDITKNLQTKADFHKARLEEHQDIDSLYVGLAKCGVTGAGIIVSYFAFKHEQALTTKFKADAGFIKIMSVIVAGVSTLPAAFSYSDFYNWRNPRHQEKYDGFSLIISRIEHALTTPRVVEEQIITL